MARLITTGFETGTLEEGLWEVTGAAGVSTTQKRSGTYAAYLTVGASSGYVTIRSMPLAESGATEYWSRHWIYSQALGDSYVWAAFDAAGAEMISVRRINATGLLALYRGAKIQDQLASCPLGLSMSEWHKVKVRYTEGKVSGRIQVWLDNYLALDYSGDVSNAANDKVQFIDMRSHNAGWNATAYLDDAALNDNLGTEQTGDPGDGSVLYLKANGNGNYAQWTGSDADQVDNYAHVDEVPVSDADYVEDSTLNHKDSYTIEDVPAGIYQAVRLAFPWQLSKLAAAGEEQVANFLRIGSTDYEDASPQDINGVLTPKPGDIRYANPATGAAWTISDIDGLEVGVVNKS